MRYLGRVEQPFSGILYGKNKEYAGSDDSEVARDIIVTNKELQSSLKIEKIIVVRFDTERETKAAGR
ncbi:unnamed protein product [Toxocara canis]|uniref:LSM14 domain-containing protein n=1 Tax=Toxocara canis TaxID=6265 RepID=A0A183UGV9_TOXCA|nr:unnamed protein product [Toxocara canis]